MPKRKSPRRVNTTALIVAGLTIIVVVFIFLNNSGTSGNSLVINNTGVPPIPTLSAVRVAEGETLYLQYCAECHGVDLKGSPTWKQRLEDGSLPPPPQDDTGHTWHHSDRQLIGIIQNGGAPEFNSKMPGFGDKLTEDQIISILEFFKSTWGMEAREAQWSVSVRSE
jgi:mono/diheme cytochrome c family protein